MRAHLRLSYKLRLDSVRLRAVVCMPLIVTLDDEMLDILSIILNP
jgi:hypothetical protein